MRTWWMHNHQGGSRPFVMKFPSKATGKWTGGEFVETNNASSSVYLYRLNKRSGWAGSSNIMWTRQGLAKVLDFIKEHGGDMIDAWLVSQCLKRCEHHNCLNLVCYDAQTTPIKKEHIGGFVQVGTRRTATEQSNGCTSLRRPPEIQPTGANAAHKNSSKTVRISPSVSRLRMKNSRKPSRANFSYQAAVQAGGQSLRHRLALAPSQIHGRRLRRGHLISRRAHSGRRDLSSMNHDAEFLRLQGHKRQRLAEQRQAEQRAERVSRDARDEARPTTTTTKTPRRQRHGKRTERASVAHTRLDQRPECSSNRSPVPPSSRAARGDERRDARRRRSRSRDGTVSVVSVDVLDRRARASARHRDRARRPTVDVTREPRRLDRADARALANDVDPEAVQTWQLWFGFFAGLSPVVIAAWSFEARAIQLPSAAIARVGTRRRRRRGRAEKSQVRVVRWVFTL